ncbi:LD-carboxypeptidase [Candidatus Dojkabacteria bacterium]|nr:LD-carboxypeptidase [Candidatus Dojkabacteria bacterium]
MVPVKLKLGDTIRVIAPARSLAMHWLNNQEMKTVAKQRFDELGLELTFGKHVYEIDEFDSTSIENRIEDIHDAFADPAVKMLITVIGGFNSNQLLRYLDYELIKQNPKIICGYSDITALVNAINAKTGLITYVGPHYFSFGDIKTFDYSLEYFKKCLLENQPFNISPSTNWSDDRWTGRQDERNIQPNEGFWLINEGEGEGRIVGGNQCTLNLLQGTEYMPDLTDSILFLEDDSLADAATFDRDIQSIIHQPDFEGVKGIVIGRFQRGSNITRELLTKIIKTKKELNNLPIIANVDFGHTQPILTLPIGGEAKLKAMQDNVSLNITKH